MRALIVERHRAGETPLSISRAVGVSPATIRKWLGRFRAEGLKGLCDRSSRPQRLRTKASCAQKEQIERLRRERQTLWHIARQVGLSRATVARIAKSLKLSRLSALDPKPEIIRYEKEVPGEMIHVDIKKLEQFHRTPIPEGFPNRAIHASRRIPNFGGVRGASVQSGSA
jgi:transposase